MGVDIRMYLEVKDNTDKKWKHVEPDSGWHKSMTSDVVGEKFYQAVFGDTEFPWTDPLPIWSFRNYTLFTLLAGVRNTGEIPPISDPKGFPEDMNWYTKSICMIQEEIMFGGYVEEVNHNPGYGYSFVTKQELLECPHKDHPHLTKFYKWVVKEMLQYHKSRLVFWFD